MKLSLNENIRAYRKKMSLTQEQLAEAMGVSVATVSKWEGGSICPDVIMLTELADFFQISVDVLLGYEWEKRSMGQCAEYISMLFRERRYEEGVTEARKAIQKYPNSFQVMYISGEMLYVAALNHNHLNMQGGEKIEEIKGEFEYAAKILERSLELFDQNTDKEISRESIHQEIGEIYGYMGDMRRAVEYLTEHNVCNLNDKMIGIYWSELKEYDKAWPYAAESFRRSLLEAWTSYISVYNVLINTDRFDEAIDLSKWTRNFCMSVAAEDSSYFEKAAVTATMLTAAAYAYKQAAKYTDYATEIKAHIKSALLSAKHFDEKPDYTGRLKLFDYKGGSIHDGFGETAFILARHTVVSCKEDEAPYKILVGLYNEMVEEMGLDKELVILEEEK